MNTYAPGQNPRWTCAAIASRALGQYGLAYVVPWVTFSQPPEHDMATVHQLTSPWKLAASTRNQWLVMWAAPCCPAAALPGCPPAGAGAGQQRWGYLRWAPHWNAPSRCLAT